MPYRQHAGQSKATTALVVGGGVAGLVSARELALQGVEVTVLEGTGRCGGCVHRHEVAGFLLDAGAESFATRSKAVSDLAGELGLGDALVQPNPAGAWLQLPESVQPLPKSGILGIPADPMDPAVIATIGRAAALRAAADKVLPLGNLLGRDRLSLGELVRARMGHTVLERLVTPVAAGVYSADPDVLDVDSVAPGLRASVASHGSLQAAVGAMRKAAPAGSAVAGIDGGMGRLTEALLADLAQRGVSVRTKARVSAVSKHDGVWRVESGAGTFQAQGLVVAADGGSAVDLLAPGLPGFEGLRPEPGPAVALVTLVLDEPELDAHPRGTGLLVAAGADRIRAKALTHATAKWPWLAAQTGPGTHVLRLSYGRATGKPESAKGEDFTGWADEALYRQALADATGLMGVPVADADILGWKVVRWTGALPSATVGHRDRVAAVRELAGTCERLQLAGAWLAGTGLVAVVTDARARSRQLAAELAAPSS